MPDSAVAPRAERSSSSAFRRFLPIGAELMGSGRTHIRIWAPIAAHLSCEITTGSGGSRVALTREPGGYFSGSVDASRGDRYQFIVDD
ncbi:MAG TPA: hypothetical protein VEU08_05335, partial [Vicinamibacterales bacterium]|nr:hypothetical protein [Vicinamibacterales bacterium]